MPLRVLVIGDDPLARSGLASLLGAEPGIEVVGQLPLTEDLARAVSATRSDVAAFDLGLDPRPGLDRLRELAEQPLPVLALLPGDEGALEAHAAGARGLLLRELDAGRLSAALVALSRGLAVIDPGLLAPLIKQRAPTPAETREGLTPRELEVLGLLAEGLPNKLIADRLGISDHTAKFHVNAILAKLGADSRTEAVVRAARLGLIVL